MIDKIIEHYGTQANLARVLEINQSAIAQWIVHGYIPPLRAVQIERATGGKFKAVDIMEWSNHGR